MRLARSFRVESLEPISNDGPRGMTVELQLEMWDSLQGTELGLSQNLTHLSFFFVFLLFIQFLKNKILDFDPVS